MHVCDHEIIKRNNWDLQKTKPPKLKTFKENNKRGFHTKPFLKSMVNLVFLAWFITCFSTARFRAHFPLSLGLSSSVSLPASLAIFFCCRNLWRHARLWSIETTASGFFFQRRCDNHWSNDCQWSPPASLFNPPAWCRYHPVGFEPGPVQLKISACIDHGVLVASQWADRYTSPSGHPS